MARPARSESSRKSRPILRSCNKPILFPLRVSLERRSYSNGVFMATPLLPDALWESDRTASSKPDAQTSRWKTTPVRSCLPPGRPVRSAQRDSLANAAKGDELWFGDELLAKVARLTRGGHLATDPLLFAGLARALRTDRLVTGSGGRQLGTGSFWGLQTGPNPTDRAKLGSKRHLVCDGQGVPLAIQLTAADRNDSQLALALVDAIPPLQGCEGVRAIA
jgi:hypothetical protein